MSGQASRDIQIDGVQFHSTIVELVYVGMELVLTVQPTVNFLIGIVGANLRGEVQTSQSLSVLYGSQNNLHGIRVKDIIIRSVHGNHFGGDAGQRQLSVG